MECSRRNLAAFASDNTAGLCPEALEAIAKATTGSQPSYGDDEYTQRATEALRELFEVELEAFFVGSGTAANCLALSHVVAPYGSVLCHEVAHVNTDEAGAPHFFTHGASLVPLPGAGAKIDPDALARVLSVPDNVHRPKLQVLSLTNSTELGLVYAAEETAHLSAMARARGLLVHLDGARFANACAATGSSPADLSTKAGVDILCFGGTKNGMGLSEAIVFFDRTLASEFGFRLKQSGHLVSKSRFLSAPWASLITSGRWLSLAKQANDAAAYLEAGLREISGVALAFPRQANALFVYFPGGVAERMLELGWRFYRLNGYYRLMCAWNCQKEDVDAFISDLKRIRDGASC